MLIIKFILILCRTGTLVSLPIQLDSPIERLHFLEGKLNDLKKSTQPLAVFIIYGIAGGLFHWMIKAFFRVLLGTVGISNFPGPAKIRALSGHVITELSFAFGTLPGVTSKTTMQFVNGNFLHNSTFSSLLLSLAGVGFGILSYVNDVIVTVAVDTAIFSDKELLQKLVECVENEFLVLFDTPFWNRDELTV